MDRITPKTTKISENIFKGVGNAEPLKAGSYWFKLEVGPLSPEFVEKAEKDLRETEENIIQALAEMREFLKGEPNLNVPNDDHFFAKFLRPCKWHSKPAFELMKRFYHYRESHPKYCDKLIPSNERAIFLADQLTPLPIRNKDGCRLVLLEGGRKWKPKEISLDQIFRGVMLLLDAAVIEPATQVNGVRVILDMDGLSLSHVTYFTPSFASSVLEWVQKCLPVRLKGVHIVNQPFIFNMVFAVFKPFFMEKLRKRLHFHGTDKQSLLSYIDAKALPKRYGGEFDLPEESVGEPIFEYLRRFEDNFVEADKLGYPKKT